MVDDVKGRLPHWHDDWLHAAVHGVRLAAPSLEVFFASVLPALAFGQQLALETEGELNVVHVLASTAIAGVTQSLAGGQPLLILGVAEPIVIIYTYMCVALGQRKGRKGFSPECGRAHYPVRLPRAQGPPTPVDDACARRYQFAEQQDGLGADLFLPWAGWVCAWTAVMVALLALLGACRGITMFTRMAGEVFGMLIAVLFLQQGIKARCASGATSARRTATRRAPSQCARPPAPDCFFSRVRRGCHAGAHRRV